jgi:filamentous hemagglutinin family protein
MDGTNMTHKRVVAGLILFAYLAQLIVVSIVLANPTGPTVVGGHATVSGLGTSHVTIAQASQQTIINWQQFNIAPNEVTRFIQPNVQAIALNRIFDQNPSQIFGSLRANGTVILLNSNGILFGPNAQVNVGGLIASSLNLSNANFLAGHYLFEGTGIEGPVKNMGAIQGSHDGVYLLAPNVENSGVITSPGGNIVLAAGAKAFLSNRPDGRGFLAELSNPLGQAVNLKDLIADGGNITLAGRVVNQAGLIRADSVREQNGKIELLASEAVTLQDGSRTLARGGNNGVSNGGTIRAIADLTNGTATFQKGAVVDVSGGKNGGNGGFAEVSGAAVRLGGQFLGRALPGFQGGRFLIDPIVSTVGPADFASFEGSGASNVTFQSPAGSDLTITGKYDLNAGWNLSGGTGTLTFLAGANLIFNNAQLTNNNSNTRWDYVGTAGTGSVLFNNSALVTGFGGNISFTAAAPSGNINLVDALGNLSILKTSAAGGDITLVAGHDVLSPSTDISGSLLGGLIAPNLFGGIRLDGPGNLTIQAGNDLSGGSVQGILTGPGFVLTNGTANVTAGGNIGGPTKGVNATDPDGYANLTLGTGTVSLTAQTGSIYLGRVQDKGMTDTSLSNKTITVDPSNKVVLQASQDIFLNPRPFGTSSAGQAASVIYPASFSATTTNGSIFVGENSVTFWPSTTGAIKLSAGQDLIGLQKQDTIPDTNYDYIFIGFKNVPGGHWQLVNLSEAVKDPALAPFVWTKALQAFNDLAKPTGHGGRTVTILTNPPNMTLLQADPQLFNNQLLDARSFPRNLQSTATNVAPHGVQDVVFEARSGDIKTLVFHLESVPFRKRVTIAAANDIEAVTAKIGAPDGVEATVRAGGSLNMRTAGTLGASAASDLTFNGTGTARVVVGGLLDLATSTGINFRYLPNPTFDVNKGGFLDLSVGGSIKMDSSLISSYNGASISIHGPGTTSILDSNGIVSIANGKPVALVGTIVQVAGQSVVQVNGKTLEFNNKTVVLNNAQTLPDTVDPVTIHLSVVEQGGKLLTASNGQPYQVLRAEDPLNAAKTLTGFDPVLVNGNLVLVAPDGTVILAPASQVAHVQSMPGSVAVGSNVSHNLNTIGAPLGITTLGGGGIDVFAKGDINVEASRISTFHGGDINLASTNGNINAGSGARNQTVTQVITQVIGGQKVTFTIQVPASGISTFHPDDPRPLTFIQFNDPEITALKNQAARETFFGRQASAAALLAKANELQAQREPIFNETVLKPYINQLKLGNVNLVAETGAVVIPSAGIQGRTVQIFAPKVDNQGGQIIGNIIIPATVNVSGPPLSITGTGTGAVATPITPVTGSSASASVSSTTAAVSTSSKSSDSVQETAAEVASQNSQSKQVASMKDHEKDGKSQLAKSIRMKHGVVIQVDVKPEVKPTS